MTCNCTNDIGIVDIRSVCRWEFASPPACAQEINLNLETQIQKNEDDFQISLETLTTTLDLAFADQVNISKILPSRKIELIRHRNRK